MERPVEPRRPYQVKLPQFEGPIDLMLSLAQQGQLDLREIPLGQIAQDYLDRAGSELDLEEATEVLWVLAAMIEMKAKALVPAPPTAEEPAVLDEPASDLAERLAGRLAEYRAFKEAAAALRALEAYQQKVFARAAAGQTDEVLLAGVTLDDLFRAFRQVLERAKEEVGEIPSEEVKVAERIDAIVTLLRGRPEGVEFPALFAPGASRLQVIVTFLALLELIKDRRVRAEQAQPFGTIRLVLVPP